MAKAGDNRTIKDLREEYFDGPASDTMTFPEFLRNEGHGDKIEPRKMSDGGAVEITKGDPDYFKDLL
jgi:hypothetical protein